jgi:hypothetical protein
VATGPNPTNALRNIAHNALTIGDITDGAIWSASPDEPPDRVAGLMRLRSYDWGVVREAPISRYFARADLDGLVGSLQAAARPILSTDCVERATPLAQLFRILRDREFVFVLDQDRVRSVVTRADLGASAVSMVVLAYLLAFEQACIALVRHSGIDVLDNVSGERRRRAERIHEARMLSNAETSIVDCFQFGDWLRLLRKSGGGVKHLKTSNKKLRRISKFLESYRNELAHGGSILNGVPASVAIERVELIIDLTERAWIEVDRLAPIWDVYIDTDIVDQDSGHVISGVDAIGNDDLPFTGKVHVISASNPRGRLQPNDLNRASTELLIQRVSTTESATAHRPVLGRSRSSDWSEASVLVEGLSRGEAARLGDSFEQDAVFEITADELRVIRCSDGEVMRTSDREVARADRAV